MTLKKPLKKSLEKATQKLDEMLLIIASLKSVLSKIFRFKNCYANGWILAVENEW